MNVVVVESPAKAKTINKYLGSDYHVVASYGHVRDLPPKDGSVDPDNDFEMLWQVDAKAAKRLNDLAKAVKDADRLILATDPDREGEAISWHVLQVLKDKKALKSQTVQPAAAGRGAALPPRGRLRGDRRGSQDRSARRGPRARRTSVRYNPRRRGPSDRAAAPE